MIKAAFIIRRYHISQSVNYRYYHEPLTYVLLAFWVWHFERLQSVNRPTMKQSQLSQVTVKYDDNSFF